MKKIFIMFIIFISCVSIYYFIGTIKKQTNEEVGVEQNNKLDILKVIDKALAEKDTKAKNQENKQTKNTVKLNENNNIESNKNNNNNNKNSKTISEKKDTIKSKINTKQKENNKSVKVNQEQPVIKKKESSLVTKKNNNDIKTSKNATSKSNQNENDKKEKIEKCTTNNNHFMKVGNCGKWFSSKEMAIAYYKDKINYWGKKWENFEISDEVYYKNCPSGYEVYSCIYCNKWTLEFYYR